MLLAKLVQNIISASMNVARCACLRYNSGVIWDIFGHDSAVAFLKEHTKPEKLRHAYLITGPQGVGRRSLALAFIKALSCPNPIEPGVTCGTCTVCRKIDAQNFSDLAVIVPESGHKDIRIEQMRELQRTMILAPYQAPYRVALILNFQNVTPGAANALLKLLEEPPSKAILILTADSQENLLPTISSRCEVLRLRPLPVVAAQNWLVENKGLPALDAKLLAHASSGRLGTALHLFEQPEVLEFRSQVLEDLKELFPANTRERFAYVESQMKRKGKTRDVFFEILSIWMTFWRDVMILATGADTPLVNIDQEQLARKVAKAIDQKSMYAMLPLLEESLAQLDLYVNPRLLMENILLAWPRI